MPPSPSPQVKLLEHQERVTRDELFKQLAGVQERLRTTPKAARGYRLGVAGVRSLTVDYCACSVQSVIEFKQERNEGTTLICEPAEGGTLIRDLS
jgi:hypothetical protein